MAGRNPKKGLDWFKHDVHYASDKDIKILISNHGNDGYAFPLHMFELIYRENNGELDISDAEMHSVFADSCKVTLEKWGDLLRLSLKYNIFDPEAYENRQVLTSDRIKESMKPVMQKRENAKKIYKPKVGQNINAGQPPISASDKRQKLHREEKRRVYKKIKETPLAMLLTDFLIYCIQQRLPNYKELQPDRCEATRMRWFTDMRLLLTKDKRPFDEAYKLLQGVANDTFWRKKILSAENFRDKYDKLFSDIMAEEAAGSPAAANQPADEKGINYDVVREHVAAQKLLAQAAGTEH